MSGYGQTIFANGSAPPINAANLNKTEAGVNAALGYDSLQEIRDLGVPANGVETEYARGHSTCSDGGGGWFHWLANSALEDDDGIVLLPTGHAGSGRWVRELPGYVNPLMFGLQPGLEADQTVILQNTFDSAWAFKTPVVLPPGKMYHTGLTYRGGQNISGGGQRGPFASSLILLPGASPAAALAHWGWLNNDVENDNEGGLSLKNFHIDTNYSEGNTAEIHGLVLMSWNVTLENLRVTAGIGNSIIGAAASIDGTPSASNFVRNSFHLVQVEGGTKGVVFGSPGNTAWTDCDMAECYFSWNGDASVGDIDYPCLDVYSAGGWRMTRNVFNAPAGIGVRLDGSKAIYVSGNRIDRYGSASTAAANVYGLQMKLGTSTIFDGSVISGNSIVSDAEAINAADSRGIYVDYGGKANNASVIVADNILSSLRAPAGAGIYLGSTIEGSAEGRISNNVIIGFPESIRIPTENVIDTYDNLEIDDTGVIVSADRRTAVTQELRTDLMRLYRDENSIADDTQDVRDMLSLGYDVAGIDTIGKGVSISLGLKSTDEKSGRIAWEAIATSANNAKITITPSQSTASVPGLTVLAEVIKIAAVSSAPVSEAASDGVIAYADGVNWDPGSGIGFYGRVGGGWQKLS